MKRINKWKHKHLKAKSFSDASIDLSQKKLANSEELKQLQEIDQIFFQIKDDEKETIINFQSQELPKIYEKKQTQNNHILNLLRSEVFDMEVKSFFQKELLFPPQLEEENQNLQAMMLNFKSDLEIIEINFNKLLSTITSQKKLMQEMQDQNIVNHKEMKIEEVNIFNESLGFKTHEINETTPLITDNLQKSRSQKEKDFAWTMTIIISVGIGLLLLWILIWFLGGR